MELQKCSRKTALGRICHYKRTALTVLQQRNTWKALSESTSKDARFKRQDEANELQNTEFLEADEIAKFEELQEKLDSDSLELLIVKNTRGALLSSLE